MEFHINPNLIVLYIINILTYLQRPYKIFTDTLGKIVDETNENKKKWIEEEIYKKNLHTSWSTEEEKKYPTSATEWWCVEAFLKSVEGKENWSVKTVINKSHTGVKKTGANLLMTLFDQKNKKSYSYNLHEDTPLKEIDNKCFHIISNDSWIKGSFPRYKMHFNDLKNNIELEMEYNATSYPRWVAQDITNGWLPLGLGFYRFGFVPKCNVSGIVRIKNKTFRVVGKGYLEHVWGNFTYHGTGLEFWSFKKSLSIYLKLIGWWIHNNKIKIPKSIILSTENNPFGYDWIWGLLENGWIILYVNTLFWIMEGPAAGLLILSKDGRTYEELGDVAFWYTKTKSAKNLDLYYPTEIEISAKKGKESLNLTFTMTDQIREYTIGFNAKKFWESLVICEAPGIVTGCYSSDKHKIKLKGICKIRPQRQISILGHNTLKIDFLKPPEGFGVKLDLCSHFLEKKIFTRVQMLPKPKVNFNCEKI